MTKELRTGATGAVFKSEQGHRVEFAAGVAGLRPVLLYGVACAGHDDPALDGGPALLNVGGMRYDARDIAFVNYENTDDILREEWSIGALPLRLECFWRFDSGTGILNRSDTLVNAGAEPLFIRRYLCRLSLQPARYEVYCQQGRWASENQGAWLSLHTGGIVLGCEEGRTAQGSTPYACVREIDAETGLVIHVVPRGNWIMRIRARPHMHGQAGCVIEAGISDEDLLMCLDPGMRWEAPAILFQPLVDGRPERSAPLLHRYALQRILTEGKTAPPVIYNTWLDLFEHLHVDRLRAQLAVVKELGCEVFVVDAGWYGDDPSGGWFEQGGDWREAEGRSFFGNMGAFADEVRAAGLKFGLWMEPEHVGPNAPVRREHPEWFAGGPGRPRLDIENPAARGWLESEMRRLIETYRCAWMKIDFNCALGRDETGAELSNYYAAWYGLLDTLRASCPHVFFEGCSSGGMRLDLASLAHFDGHFLSDNENPVDMIRIAEGAMLRLPVARLTLWAVLRSVGKTIPACASRSMEEVPESIAVPPAAGWQPEQLAETHNLDFIVLGAMRGIFGLGGDPSGLSVETRARLRRHIDFYKKWRGFIAGSYAIPLTPPRPIDDRGGWAAVQLRVPSDPRSFVFVWRLQDRREKMRFRLYGLDPSADYTVAWYPEDTSGTWGGDVLMETGLETLLHRPGSVTVATVCPA